MKVIKFSGRTALGKLDWGLDDTLVEYWHIIVPPQDYTACGQATDEYKYEQKEGKITCPYCIRTAKFFQTIKSRDMVKQ